MSNSSAIFNLKLQDLNLRTRRIKVEKNVGAGMPKLVICAAVEKLGADILVMGSHDYGFFKRALLGSVSDHCARHVKCPMLVVKRPKNEPSIKYS
ncbi:hypothetical protein RHMOL_Rhmol13G0009000 [Rhododendron molle]|uniref:Uncharacterized protein n=1 Tax=Rhododendron molle TaxID=49168 RepID=A0ACC0L272_RHOML|nr:hypothetical protein RHMOL_Rhmol13G0009000 [Rhododendron molle]